MKLADLNPRWVGNGGEGITNTADGTPVPRREGIGVSFDCPCGNPDCAPVFVPFLPTLDGGPSPYRSTWARSGDTFETLTLSPSIRRLDWCKWHGFVTNGEVTGQCEP